MSRTMSLSICDNLEKDFLVADAAPGVGSSLIPTRVVGRAESNKINAKAGGDCPSRFLKNIFNGKYNTIAHNAEESR